MDRNFAARKCREVLCKTAESAKFRKKHSKLLIPLAIDDTQRPSIAVEVMTI